jgi:hypothetical protein
MKFILSILSAMLLFSWTACKKDNIPTVPPPPFEGKAYLSVKLNNPYLGKTQVDSAYAIWKLNGEEIFITMQLRNDSLIADMERFTEGNGELTIFIFSNKKYRNQYYGQFILKKAVTVDKKQGLRYSGPTSFFDNNWFPRVELSDGPGNKAVVGLRPDDSYFFIKNVQPQIEQLVVEKGYWKTTGGVQFIAGGVWMCSTGCTNNNGDVENTNYFDMIPGRIGTKTWNHISIIILYQVKDNGEGWVLQLEYEP